MASQTRGRRCAILCGVTRVIRFASTRMSDQRPGASAFVGLLVLSAALMALPAVAGKATYPEFVPTADEDTPQLDGVTWVTEQPLYTVRLTKKSLRGNGLDPVVIIRVVGSKHGRFVHRRGQPLGGHEDDAHVDHGHHGRPQG